MNIEVFNCNPMSTNTYIVSAPNGTVVIDPVGNLNAILKYLDENSLSVKYILLTHGHGDHIGLVSELREITGAPVLIHEEDEELINDVNLNLSAYFNKPVEFDADLLLKDGEEIKVEDFVIKVIHTPGHTKGSVCYLIEDNLFCGDTLFKGSIGRTDFYGGSYKAILESLKKISKLNHNLKIYPGHGESSTLYDEIGNNPYFNEVL